MARTPLPGSLPAGWFPSDELQARSFHAELVREVPPGHLLRGRRVEVVAHRSATDDVLCRHLEEPGRFTVVHLSWRGREEVDERYPFVELDGSFEDFLAHATRV